MAFMFETVFGFLRRNLENAVQSPIAYACLILAAIGGTTAQNTFIGDVIGWPIRLLVSAINVFAKPDITNAWVVYPLIFLGGLAVLADLGREGIPERWAVYIPIVWPSLFLYIPEDSGWRAGMIKWLDGINDWLWDTFGSKIGGGGQASVLVVIAITCIATVVFYYEKLGAKKNADTQSRNTTTTNSSTPSSTRTSSTRSGRRRRPA